MSQRERHRRREERQRQEARAQQMEAERQRVEEMKPVVSSRRHSLTVVDYGRNLVMGTMPDRQCGGCTACCSAIGVEELGKPAGCDCQHQTATGCSIYERRPEDCREWHCLWRCGWGGEEDRPDKSGVLLTVDTGAEAGKPFGVLVVEMRPGAMTERFSSPAELHDLLPDLEQWVLSLRFHGTPSVNAFPIAEPYRDRAAPAGHNFYCGSPIAMIQFGVVDANGDLHTGSRTIPAEEWRPQMERKVAAYNIWADEQRRGRGRV